MEDFTLKCEKILIFAQNLNLFNLLNPSNKSSRTNLNEKGGNLGPVGSGLVARVGSQSRFEHVHKAVFKLEP